MLNSPALRRFEAYVRRCAFAVWGPLRNRPVVALAVRVVREMSDDDATHMAAGVAYYAVLSLFPLTIGLIAVFNLLSGSELRQAQLTEFLSEYLPGSEALLSRNVRVGGALGVISILGLLWSGSAIFGAVTRVVNRAWDIHRDRPLFVSKPRQLVMALVVGLMFLASLAAAGFVRATERYVESDLPAPAFLVNLGGQALLQTGSFILTLIIFLMIYKMLPNTRTYWRYVWPGALAAAALLEAGKAVFLFYLDRFASIQSVYGSVGDVVVLLLWVYVSSLILILGAELSSEYGRMREGKDRGVLLHPGPSG